MKVTEPVDEPLKTFRLTFRDAILELRKPVVMGILNVTPDSFYDGGYFRTENDILYQAEKMLKDGAAIIDIGAVSTRPSAKEISEKDEWQRLMPVLNSLVNHFPAVIFSIDTFRSRIAEGAIKMGAQMINDISGGTFDGRMAETVGRLKVPYILMHIKGTPQNMQVHPEYKNVVEDVMKFFELQLQKFKAYGVTENIILDPGFGFGKTVEHNFQLLKNLRRFHDTGFPVCAGLSRKSMINKVLNTKPLEALNGTTVLHVIALLNGANILRVHDVKEAVQAIELVQSYQNTGKISP
jgi:dihydropteroate synthase